MVARTSSDEHIPSPSAVESCIYFMKRDSRHDWEKPYAWRFVADIETPQTNFIVEAHEGMVIQNMRDFSEKFTIEQNGFAILKLPRPLQYDHYFDPKRIGAYFQSLEELLAQHLGARRVEIFRHSIRKRHPKFPLSTGGSYAFDQPTSIAHVDTTPEYTLEQVRQREVDRSKNSAWSRVQWINIWKPLRGPVNDWPLAICDTQTVNPVEDYEQADLLFEHHVAENFQVHYNPDHKWYYLADHLDDELIIFKQSDTDVTASPGVAHSSFFNPLARADERPRESIEARAFVFYD